MPEITHLNQKIKIMSDVIYKICEEMSHSEIIGPAVEGYLMNVFKLSESETYTKILFWGFNEKDLIKYLNHFVNSYPLECLENGINEDSRHFKRVLRECKFFTGWLKNMEA